MVDDDRACLTRASQVAQLIVHHEALGDGESEHLRDPAIHLRIRLPYTERRPQHHGVELRCAVVGHGVCIGDQGGGHSRCSGPPDQFDHCRPVGEHSLIIHQQATQRHRRHITGIGDQAFGAGYGHAPSAGS